MEMSSERKEITLLFNPLCQVRESVAHFLFTFTLLNAKLPTTNQPKSSLTGEKRPLTESDTATGITVVLFKTW